MTSLKKLLPALALGIAAIPAFAGDEPALDKADTAWIMVAGLLVLFMTIPGIALFYAGMVRKKNMLSTLAQSVAICGLMSILWYAVGYSLAFSEGTPFIGGLSKAFLSGISISTLSGSIPELLFVFFQMTFAILTPALITGSLAERMKFSSLCVFMVAWSLLVYAPICHWVWASDGFFFQMGALDYAGGTVVHI
ncbi:ammonium transporter, partial [Sutterella wadsworthensis]